MPDCDYLIVGGGMTAAAAIGGINEVDEGARIGLISAEPDPPPRESIWARIASVRRLRN